MPTKPTKYETIVDALALNETVLGQLYQEYARQFDDHAAFWERLARDEHSHAAVIRAMGKYAAEGAMKMNPRHYRTHTVHSFLKYLRQHILQAPGSPLVRALSVAVDIERSLIEKNFFIVFEPQTAAARKLLDAMHRGIEKHYATVCKAWDRERKRASQG